MLNSDRFTRRALLPVAIVNGTCVRAFAALPTDIFPAATVSETQVVTGVPTGRATSHWDWSLQGHNICDTRLGGVTARSQYSLGQP
jgi:hypothetical protein